MKYNKNQNTNTLIYMKIQIRTNYEYTKILIPGIMQSKNCNFLWQIFFQVWPVDPEYLDHTVWGDPHHWHYHQSHDHFCIVLKKGGAVFVSVFVFVFSAVFISVLIAVFVSVCISMIISEKVEN